MLLKRIKYILIVMIGFFICSWVWFTYQINIKPSKDEANIIFTIEAGEGTNQISDELYQNGLIKNKLAFETYAWFWGKEDEFIAGRHNLNKTMSVRRLTKLLTTKAEPRERDIIIIEGWNNQQIADYLEKEGVVGSVEFIEYLNKAIPDLMNDYQFLEGLDAAFGLEGYLFPDTYRIFNQASAADIIRKMLSNFEKKLTVDLQDEITRQGKTLNQVVILASVVEKEVATTEDRKIVAGIFLKRLRDNYPLQSDATVNYITGKNMLQPTYEDTKIDSPYNTYKYLGLPPGAICNPGLDSIMAVIYPNQTPYYYFLTTPDGEVIYSKTYSEHLKNKDKYLN